MTDHEGRFRFPYLSVGRYEIKIRHAGFGDVTRALTLTVGAAFELPIALAVATTGTSVTVKSDAVVLEAARSQIAATIPQAEIAQLPLSGRNYFDVALFVAGVSPTNTAANQLFAETSAMPGQGISIGSQRNFSNSFIIDGVSANDDAAGVAGTFIGLDTVDEFQVVTSGGQAELGRALGGYVNVVTKSGGNTLHGDAYGYFRSSAFNSANAAIEYRSAAHPGAVWREPFRSRDSRSDILFRQFRRARLEPVGPRDHFTRQCSCHQRTTHRGRLPRPSYFNGGLSKSSAQREFLRQGGSSVQRYAISSARATASITWRASIRAAPAG